MRSKKGIAEHFLSLANTGIMQGEIAAVRGSHLDRACGWCHSGKAGSERQDSDHRQESVAVQLPHDLVRQFKCHSYVSVKHIV